MKTLKFASQNEMFQTLSAILHLGNIQFQQQGDASRITNPNSLQFAAQLLGVDENSLTMGLINKKTITRGETFVTPLNLAQALDSRDALSKGNFTFNMFIMDRI